METELKAVQRLAEVSTEFAVNYGFQALGAVIILIAGWYTSSWLGGVVTGLCARRNIDVTLSRFFSSLTRTILLAFVIIIALGKFGITIAPFIAAVGAVAFGGTLALQAPLSNYGAGLSIILSRPFVVGDTIKVKNVTGIVEDIRLAHTRLSNEDGELITIPNKEIVGEIIHNSSANLVVEATVGISYDSDYRQAIDVVEGLLKQSAVVAAEPSPQVGIDAFGESAIEIGYRYWLPTRIYHQARFSLNADIYAALKQHGIVIPYPRRDVRVLTEPGAG